MQDATLGFVGLGVMGGPMCRNLARKAGRPVIAFDLHKPAPDYALTARSVAEVAQRADIVFLSLPGESEISPGARARRALCPLRRRAGGTHAPGGDRRHVEHHGRCEPAALRPYRAAAPVHGERCHALRPPGAGQAVKLLNNMVLSVTVLALAEALAVAKASGAVQPALLFETLAKGSADSFALRNHGMKALLPEHHAENAFPVSYMLKDLGYALELARSAGLDLQAAATARRMLEHTVALGLGDAYHTAVLAAVRKQETK
jgi:3-hydroxyisobutyrate dehydrogenase-like beta-hydroxyacid dehydrogenase